MSTNHNSNYNAGDETQVKKKKSRYAIEQEKQRSELKELLETAGGRYFVWRLLSFCGLYSSAPDEGMARFEGRRDVGLHLLTWLNDADPEAIGLMQLEAMKREGNG